MGGGGGGGRKCKEKTQQFSDESVTDCFNSE